MTILATLAVLLGVTLGAAVLSVLLAPDYSGHDWTDGEGF